MQAQLDRLSVENAALRRQLARMQYGPGALNRALAEANDTGVAEVCTCPGCFIAKRFAELEPDDVLARFGGIAGPERACIVRDCLRWHCERLGLTCLVSDEAAGHASDTDSESGGSDTDSESDGSDTDSESGGSDTLDDGDTASEDCHVVIVEKGGYWEVEYGRRLCLEGLHENNQLDALKELFDLLQDGEGFFKADGRDCY
jgi:hypothetical protein